MKQKPTSRREAARHALAMAHLDIVEAMLNPNATTDFGLAVIECRAEDLADAYAEYLSAKAQERQVVMQEA